MANAREPTTPAEAIGLLDGEAGVASACEAVESWTKSGRWDDLLALAAELEARCEPDRSDRLRWFEVVADHVEDQLALGAGDAAVDAVLALSLRERKRSVSVPRLHDFRVRALASRLGFGQSVDALLGALARAGDREEHRELFACWMHEVVLRGTSLASEDLAKRFQSALTESSHPLGGLPLALRGTEREAPSYMPLYGDRGLGRAIDTLTSGPMSVRTIPPPASGADVRATWIADERVEERMRSAVRPWAEGKSGKVEAKVFSLEPKLEKTPVGSWLLRALDLDATRSVTRLDVSRTGPEGVFGPLFSAASNGGAYSSGLGGAYGRLAAWTSLGALVGAAEAASIEDIDARALSSSFLTFRAPGPWFYDIAWDLGVLALRPDGATAAVLAATDAE